MNKGLNAVQICEASLRWSFENFEAELKKKVGSATVADPKNACNRLMLIAATAGFESLVLRTQIGGFPSYSREEGAGRRFFVRYMVCWCCITCLFPHDKYASQEFTISRQKCTSRSSSRTSQEETHGSCLISSLRLFS